MKDVLGVSVSTQIGNNENNLDLEKTTLQKEEKLTLKLLISLKRNTWNWLLELIDY